MFSKLRRLDPRFKRRVILGSLLSALGLIPLIYGHERFLLSMSQDRNMTRQGTPRPFARIEGPGLVQPPISGAKGSGMLDEDEVIGIEIGGRARAYRLAAMSGRTTHIVNDLLSGVPVSVAYCDMTDCVRVYTDPKGSAPLDFSVGGLYVDNGPEMVLKLDEVFFFQKSGKSIEPGAGPAAIPYDQLVPIRTTWKEWLHRHPETDVFSGRKPVEVTGEIRDK